MRTVEKIEEVIEVANHEDTEGNTSIAEKPIRVIQRNFDESDPEWEFYLERVAEEAPLSVKGFLDDLRNKSAWGSPSDGISPEEFALENRWTKLFTLCKAHVFAGRFEAAADVLETYSDQFAEVEGDFKQRGIFRHLQSEILKNLGGEENMREAFSLALDANNSFNNHPGVQNNIGEIIATSLSEGYSLSGIHSLAGSRNQLIRIGIDLLEESAREHGEVPEYHVTYGRLLAHRDDFEEARKEIHDGIRLLDRNRDRYYVKRSDFQRFLSQVERQHKQRAFDGLSTSMDELRGSLSDAKSEIDGLQERSEKLHEKMDEEFNNVLRKFQTRNLQFIAFFAGMLTVTIAVVDTAINMTYEQAAGLILILVGGLLVAFTGLLNVLPRTEPETNGVRTRMAVNVVVGALLVAVGLALPYVNYG